MALAHMDVAGSELLRVEKVDVSIDGREILNDVNFRIDHGEFTGLIGANGSGKTTLFRVILGLQTTLRGEVTVHGEPLQRANRSLGYVPQKVLFDPDMPIRARDLVALALTAIGMASRGERAPTTSRSKRCSLPSTRRSSPTEKSAASRAANSSAC